MNLTYDDSIISGAEATSIVRSEMQALNEQLPLAPVFPNQSNGKDKTVSWTPNVLQNRPDGAHFSAWDAEPERSATTTFGVKKHLDLTPIRMMMDVTERNLIDNVDSTEWKRQKLEENLKLQAKQIEWRFEKVRLDAIVNAHIVLDENNVKGDINFDRDRALSPTLAAAKKWDQADTDPYKDIKGWVKMLTDREDGAVPTAVLTSTSVIDALSENAKFIQNCFGVAATTLPTTISREQVIGTLAKLGLTDVRLIDEEYNKLGYKRDSGINDFYPKNTFTLLPALNSPSLGFTAIGPTVESGISDYGIPSGDGSGFIGLAYRAEMPVRLGSYVNGSGMPVLVAQNSTLNATVL
ncbi:major capsid protein [Bifidobacterium olomucense]|uniref:Minor capsid protein E n=1 Tax=Bifidobacterium olomucense TaxID=2675324 RepID=A0A7Y0EXC7_9BIFI|nr:major capsid protein [Bifidobacterium sp. DSM 109959]NMM98151.1 minor capsid protein E [Bifidobacterium sp. DSM 109959]